MNDFLNKNSGAKMQREILEKLATIEKLLKNQTEKPLTLGEAARYLDLSTSTLYKMTSSSKIGFYKPNRKRIYFDKSDLDAWILRNRVKTETEIEQEANDYLTNGIKRGEQ